MPLGLTMRAVLRVTTPTKPTRWPAMLVTQVAGKSGAPRPSITLAASMGKRAPA